MLCRSGCIVCLKLELKQSGIVVVISSIWSQVINTKGRKTLIKLDCVAFSAIRWQVINRIVLAELWILDKGNYLYAEC